MLVLLTKGSFLTFGGCQIFGVLISLEVIGRLQLAVKGE